MISSEVQRTLVKSPPELWAELSDRAALARHLGELGEIRITRIDPERTVEWEAEDTTGAVRIKPSGWGTKVTLTVTREMAEPERQLAPESPAETEPTVGARPGLATQAAPEPSMQAEPESAAEPEPAAELKPALEPPPGPQPAPAAAAAEEREPEPGLATQAEEALEPESELAPRRSFFMRMFRRRHTREAVEPEPPTDTASPEPVPEPEPAELEEPAVGPGEAESSDIAAELLAAEKAAAAETAAEEAAAAEVTAVLTSVLDRLGAAHHRPFSRA